MAVTVVWTLGSFSFIDDGGSAPLDVRIAPGWRVNPVVLVQKHGAFIVTSPFRAPTPINLSGRMYGATGEALRDKVDTLQNVIVSGRVQLNIFNDRYMNVICQESSFSYPAGAGLQVVDFVLDLLADEAVWISETLDTSNHLTNSTPSITNSGNAATPPVITVTAGGAGLTAFSAQNTTSGKTLSWAGSLTSGQVLEIDMENFTITEAGVESLSGFSGVFWDLIAGANALSLTSTPTGIAVVITKRNRWA